jgi:hypothetical protein
MIEALGASRLKIIFVVETIYPCYSQTDADENGPPKNGATSLRLAKVIAVCG